MLGFGDLLCNDGQPTEHIRCDSISAVQQVAAGAGHADIAIPFRGTADLARPIFVFRIGRFKLCTGGVAAYAVAKRPVAVTIAGQAYAPGDLVTPGAGLIEIERRLYEIALMTLGSARFADMVEGMEAIIVERHRRLSLLRAHLWQLEAERRPPPPALAGAIDLISATIQRESSRQWI